MPCFQWRSAATTSPGTFTTCVDLGKAEALRSLGQNYGFTPDGKSLLLVDYDYEHRDQNDHPYTSYAITDFSTNVLAAFSYPDGRASSSYEERSSNEPSHKFSNIPAPISADFALGWSEFGLETLTYRKKNSAEGEDVNRTLLCLRPKARPRYDDCQDLG